MIGVVLRVGVFVFIGFHAPWYVTVLSVLVAMRYEAA